MEAAIIAVIATMPLKLFRYFYLFLLTGTLFSCNEGPKVSIGNLFPLNGGLRQFAKEHLRDFVYLGETEEQTISFTLSNLGNAKITRYQFDGSPYVNEGKFIESKVVTSNSERFSFSVLTSNEGRVFDLFTVASSSLSYYGFGFSYGAPFLDKDTFAKIQLEKEDIDYVLISKVENIPGTATPYREERYDGEALKESVADALKNITAYKINDFMAPTAITTAKIVSKSDKELVFSGQWPKLTYQALSFYDAGGSFEEIFKLL